MNKEKYCFMIANAYGEVSYIKKSLDKVLYSVRR